MTNGENFTIEQYSDKFLNGIEMIFGLNYNNHRTENFLQEFENKSYTQVCRRGQTLKLGINFSQVFNDSYRLYIRMYFGKYEKSFL